MSRKIVFGLLGMCLFATGCSKMKWREFNCLDGQYSIQMPGDPEMKTQRIGTRLFVTYSIQVGSIVYIVDYADTDGPDKDLSQFGESLASGNNGTITKRNDWTLDGVKGVECEIHFKGEENHYYSGRSIVINNRMYEIFVRGKNAKLDNPDVKKFFESFKVTK
jgi:hypothetical protein